MHSPQDFIQLLPPRKPKAPPQFGLTLPPSCLQNIQPTPLQGIDQYIPQGPLQPAVYLPYGMREKLTEALQHLVKNLLKGYLGCRYGVLSTPLTARRFVQIEDGIHLVLLLSADVVKCLKPDSLRMRGCMPALEEVTRDATKRI